MVYCVYPLGIPPTQAIPGVRTGRNSPCPLSFIPGARAQGKGSLENVGRVTGPSRYGFNLLYAVPGKNFHPAREIPKKVSECRGATSSAGKGHAHMTESEWLASDRSYDLIDHAMWMPRGASSRKLLLFVAGVTRLDPAAVARCASIGEAWETERVADGGDSAIRREFYPPGIARTVASGAGASRQAADLARDILGNPFRPFPGEVPCGGCGGQTSPWGHHRFFCCPCDGTTDSPVLAWLTPDVLSLARAAYEERPGRECEQCKGTKRVLKTDTRERGLSGRHNPVYASRGKTLVDSLYKTCPACNGTGRIEDGTLDGFRLTLVADALEEAGCPVEMPCPVCGAIEETTDRLSPWFGVRCPCGKSGGGGSVSHPLLAHLRSPGPHWRGCWALDLLLGKE